MSSVNVQIKEIKRGMRRKFFANLWGIMACIFWFAVLVFGIIYYHLVGNQLLTTFNTYGSLIFNNMEKAKNDGSSDFYRQIEVIGAVNGAEYAILYDAGMEKVAEWYRDANKDIVIPTTIDINSYKTDSANIHALLSQNVQGRINYLRLGFQKKILLDDTNKIFIIGFIVLISGTYLGHFFIWRRFRMFAIDPLENVTQKARQILEGGDLTIEIPEETNDEYGQLASIINANNRTMCNLLQDISACCKNFTQVNLRLSKTGSTLEDNIRNMRHNVDDSTQSITGLIESFTQVGRKIGKLSADSDHSASMIYDMAHLNQNVAQDMSSLGQAVNASVSSIEQLTSSIENGADNMEMLAGTLNAVSASMNRLDESIAQEEKGAHDTLALARQLKEDASVGMDVMDKTIEGIGHIKESAAEVSSIISELSGHVNNIGSILKVIEEVANQTNLLALNAAIIAAQAGDQGRGFAVVADEIGSLAVRTKNSTKEISELISSIQQATQQAFVAMQRDQAIIANGSMLGQKAVQSFGKLKISADESAGQSQKMSELTCREIEEIRSTVDSVRDIAMAIDELNKASQQQAADVKLINKNTREMGAINDKVMTYSSEQASSSHNALTKINNISNLAAEVNARQQEQTDEAKKVVAAVSSIADETAKQEKMVREMEEIILTIGQHVRQLSSYLEACKF